MRYRAGQIREGGFTLVEILLVMLITSILLLGVNTAYRQGRLIWTNIESRRPIYANARLVTETLRQELAGLYIPNVPEQKQIIPFHLSCSPEGTIELSFYTLTPCWITSVRSSYIARLSYSFSKGDDIGESILKRTEQYCAGEKIIGTQRTDVILKGLADFKVWALGGGSDSSSDSWQANIKCKDAPPKALKIVLRWPGNNNSGEIVFNAVMMVPCRGKLEG